MQALQVLVRFQHVRVQRQLVRGEQPGAVLAGVVVVQALLYQVLLHEHGFPLGLRLPFRWSGPVPLRLGGAALGGGPGRGRRWVLGLQAAGERAALGGWPAAVPALQRWVGPPVGKGTSGLGPPVARRRGLLLEDGEQRLALHTLLLLQLVELLPQHVLVPLAEPGKQAWWSPQLGEGPAPLGLPHDPHPPPFRVLNGYTGWDPSLVYDSPD